MIDFATLQGLDIPEGKVTKVADAAGQVLWTKMVTITITGSGRSGYFPDNVSTYAHVTVGYIQYVTPVTLSVPAGTTIKFLAYSGKSTDGYITLNGTKVGSKNQEYSYVVNKDIDVKLSVLNDSVTQGIPAGVVDVTER